MAPLENVSEQQLELGMDAFFYPFSIIFSRKDYVWRSRRT